ncbi:MAG: conserved repeat domain, partial [Acidobacteria bacterium]|nr:conserved repeat domain [Acidobacteriota bacterium]
MNIQKSFSSRTGSKTLYLMTLFTLVALTAVGFFVLPNNTGTASASSVKSDGRATAEMLRVALDLRTATEYSVFAEQGIKEDGRSSVKGGNSGVASRDAEMGARVRNDLAASFNAINQLPATEISQLRSGSYSAGVYAAKSADLAGEFVLDAAGDQNAIFVFRVDGAITAKSGLNFSLVNGANAGNVFFVSNERASVEAGVDFAGNILAKGSINVEAGAKVNGRTLSLGGEVQLTEAAVGGGTGILEICKEAAGAGLENRVFAFRIGGIVREAPVGGCTGPIDLPAGPVTIEELLEGRTLPAGTFTNRFRLLSVTSSVAGSLGTVNLPLRTAVVNVREGSIANQTVVTFTNTFAIMAVIEICKRPALAIGSTTADSLDVTGFFSFTVDAIQNTTFSVPVGACSGPIQVTVPTFAGPFPAPGDVTVTELGRPGFTLESGSTFPADRFNEIVLGSGVNNTDPRCIDERRDANGVVIPAYALPTTCFFPNAGGGYISGDVLEGGTASQTTFNFFNRANPAVLKICKIAGPGIPEGTPFTYEVRGTAPSGPGRIIAPGVQVTRDVTVLAGPAAQGGFCEFVETAPGSGVNQTFVVGTNIAVVETDFFGTIPGVGPGQVRTANIRSSTGFTAVPATVTASPSTVCVPNGSVALTAANGGNPDLEYVVAGQTNCNGASFISSAAIVPSRAATVEVEFTNFVFNPTLLKICKIAGNGTAVGTPFTFNVAISNPASFGLNGALYAPALTTVSPVTVQAGPASQGGYCTFAQGPFTPTVSTPPVGT